MEEISKIYKRLAGEKRLFIPAQVAREFASNRSSKLTAVYQQLGNKRENVKLKTTEYPLLESLPEYQTMLRAEKAAQQAVKDLQAAVDKVLEVMREWRWNDPVSSMYRDIFGGDTIVNLQVAEEELATEAKERFSRQIPPGYKDAAKEENAYGDFIIWKTILHLGAKRRKHVIFVSGDEKADWWHQSNNVALYPRYELVEEFRRVTEGLSFHIFTFAEFLQHLGATRQTVEEVKREEILEQPFQSKKRWWEIIRSSKFAAERAVFEWLRTLFAIERVIPCKNEELDIIVTCGLEESVLRS